ncbi:MAG: hypothetical protein HYV07_18360 [Deltaproteobacteria bacterium]|nr:hypothetical protein [Deltaproteobacteria bacterium]
MRGAQTFATAMILGSVACSGGVTCSGCGGAPLDPIPGGFDPAAVIERGIQARFTTSGTDFIGAEFPSLVRSFARMKCGPGEPVACPDRFRTVQGTPAPTACDPVSLECVAPTGDSEPVLGFPIERTVSSGAIVCRDEPTDPIPSVRECSAWLRLEGLELTTLAPNEVRARVTVQIYTTQIPFRYDPLGADCLLEVDSSRGSSRLQDFEVTAQLRPYPGADGGQLELAITDVATPSIEEEDLVIQRDPVQADSSFELFCRIADLPALQPIIVGIFARQLGDVLDTEIRKALGWQCGSWDDVPCPASATCSTAGFCEDSSGTIIPQRLGAEGRIDLPTLLRGFAPTTLGSMDVSFLVGGQQSADPLGLDLGIRAGMEVAERDAACALDVPSPRTRPGFVAPPALPTDDKVDLDFDGTKETPYMVAAAVSDSLVDQAIWSVYESGLFCQSISSYDIELLNTGSLAVLIPSLRQLTHQDLDPRSIWPAAVRISPGAEPRVVLGSGEVRGSRLIDPLMRLDLNRMRIDFSAMVEERWVQLMTVEADVSLPLGMVSNPDNELELVLGDLEQGITNIHVTRSELLGESREELEDAIPALIGTALPDLTGALAVPFGIPSGTDLGGFTLDVLGIRGVQIGSEVRFFAAYANLGFDPALAPQLSYAVETDARIASVEVPSSAEMAVTGEGRPRLPKVELAVLGSSSDGSAREHQVRIDGGLWSAFGQGDSWTLSRPELLVQGPHRIEVRSREIGRYRTLDPTPVALEVRIDTEPPALFASLVPEGLRVKAFDVVSGDRVSLEVLIGDEIRSVVPDRDGFVGLPGLDPEVTTLGVRARDEAGLETTKVFRAAVAVEDSVRPASCHCTSTHRPEDALMAALFALLLVARVYPALRRA